MSMLEFILCFAVIGIISFTNMGGLGSAGSFVPIFLGLYHFDTRNAIALANFVSPWASLVRYIAKFREPHPLKNGHGILVDFNICTLIIPSAIIGANVGSIVNLMMPAPVMLSLLILTTIAMVYQALRKYCALLKSERQKQVKLQKDAESSQSIELKVGSPASSNCC